MTARNWFASLSTGEKRAAASAITDQAFLYLFLDLCAKSDEEGNVPLSLEEITTLYQRQLTASQSFATKVDNKSSSNPSNEKPSSNQKSSATDESLKTPMKESKPDTNCASTDANASAKEASASPSAQGKLTKLLSMLMSHVYTLLPSAFSAEVNEVEVWLKTGNPSSKKKRGKIEQKDENRETALGVGQVAALALDPTIVDLSGESNLFYNLADKIVGLTSKGSEEVKGNGAERFLMSVGDGTSMWPAWLTSSCADQQQVPVGLLLLAGFEKSINAAHQRSTLDVGDVMVHIAGESSLHKVWSQHSSSTASGAASQLSGEIEQVFRVRKTLIESGKKVKPLVSSQEWSELASSFKREEGSFKPDHLLATPLQWIVSSPSAGKQCEIWNALVVEVFSKLVNGMRKRQEEGNNGADMTGETLTSPSKKKKKKSNKKKGKKQSSIHEPNIKKEDEKPGPSQQPAAVLEKEVKVASIVVANGERSSEVHVEDPSSNVSNSLETEEKSVESSRRSAVTAKPAENDPSKPVSEEEKPETKPSDSTIASSKEGENKAKDEESKANDDADEWETVAVKTRKPKAKQANEQSNNNKSNSGNRSSQSGRNGNNNNGSSNGEGGNGRRRDRKKNRKDKEKDRGRRNQTNNQTTVVKDVITHILDAVDDEVCRRGKQGAKSVSSDDKRKTSNNDKQRSSTLANNNRNNNDQRRRAATPTTTTPALPNNNAKQQPRSLRDIVAGVAATPANSDGKSSNDDQSKLTQAPTEPSRGAKIKAGVSYKSVIDTRQKPVVVTPTAAINMKASDKIEKAADSKMAKTNPTSAGESKKDSSFAQGKTKPVPAAGTKEDAAKEDSCQSPPSATEDDRNIPPLSTLLGPGTSCSANSSVASSLEAPHSSRFRHQSISSTEDVGVHLLNVCKQLSNEIDAFMSRRSLALDIRRKERSAVLGALQDTLLKIWPGNCHVEMYGSCATQLDLPSSDLDLVVCGLDEMMMNPIPIDPVTGNLLQSPTNSNHNLHSLSPSGSTQNLQRQQSYENNSQQLHQSFDNSVHSMPPSPGEISVEQPQQDPSQQDFNSSMVEPNPDDVNQFVPEGDAGMVYDASEEDATMGMDGYAADYHGQQEFYYVPYNYIPPMSLNAQRVIRLASELEMQPWAVQVKAIPTAAVPVVKILADPSKLPGAVGTGDGWMMQQHIAAQAGAPGTPPMSPEQIPSTPSQFSTSSHFFSQPSMPSWRGADIMNGLQPVDITFEGPEHGGIGSTTFSACVVQDACNETGLSPEKTPVVQVKMVLKELLAQRRLNEPFTGGLSSYALLLLLLAVVKERQIIQEEMERVEKQRQEVNQQDTRDSKPKQKQINGPPKLSAAQIVAGKVASSKPPKSKVGDSSSSADIGNADAAKKAEVPKAISKQVSSSSWASIAKKSNGSTVRTDSMSTATISNSSSLKKPSIADKIKNATSKNSPPAPTLAQSGSTMNSVETESEPTQSKIANTLQQSKVFVDGQVPPSTEEEMKPPLIPECSNDVLEVLCSGEMTSGKLLMHFLLFYGQHFDAQSTLIDVNGTHHPEYGTSDLMKLSPFVTRPPGGNIDPVTGMYSVDPIVVYDPLEGAMDHNVAKRCYCWNNIKWVFAQSYMTVSSIVETSGTSSNAVTKERNRRDKKANDSVGAKKAGGRDAASKDQTGVSDDMISPILELLLSF